MKRKPVFLFIFLILANILYAQNPATDTAQTVHILNAKNLIYRQTDASTEIQILSGKVQLRQGTTLFYCDSCIVNNTSHLFEAYGNVHVNDNDTVNVYSDYLRYLTNTKMAYLNGNVKLSDGHATLFTPDLQYDVNNKIGTYTNGGRVINKKSVLTSKEGIYYADIRDIYFKRNVELKDPAYYLKSDSLLYNTETQIARFIAETYIRDSSKRVIRTREGFFDVAHNKSEFTSRTTIEDGASTASADRIANDDKTGIIQLEGRAALKDTAKGMNILADKIFVNKKIDAFLATKKPLMIIKQDKDSIYVTADTLFSARLTDLYKSAKNLNKIKDSTNNDIDSTGIDSTNQDSVKMTKSTIKEKDSTNRYFEAYRHVRVFSDSLQSVSDSLFYSFKDSVFHLFYDPVVWNKKSQITGDTIYLYTKNKKPSRIKVIENSFIVSEEDPGVYDQIKSSKMDGFFKEGVLDSVRAKGSAESVYFIRDKDSAYTSVNQTKSDVIDVFFIKGEIYKVVFRSDLKGNLYPIKHKLPSEAKLENFKWLDSRRPKTKYELFE
jgi:lipopolysaccharide export system protein LptA